MAETENMYLWEHMFGSTLKITTKMFIFRAGIVTCCNKLLPRTSALCVGVLIPVLDILLPSQFQTNIPGKQCITAQVLEFPLALWETWMEFLALDFSLA